MGPSFMYISEYHGSIMDDIVAVIGRLESHKKIEKGKFFVFRKYNEWQ